MLPRVGIVVLLAVGLAAFTYFSLERLGRRGVPPMLARAVAWTALGLLLVNVSCPRPPAARRPLVLLDASLSLSGAGGRWDAARSAALAAGDVRLFGDERMDLDSAPSRGRSLLAPALVAAAASDRPVLVVTDGEIEDAADLPPDLLARATVRTFPRDSTPDLAITALRGPERITAGDSIPFELEVRALRGARADDAVVTVQSGTRELTRRAVRFDSVGVARFRFAAPSAALAAGDQVLRIALGARAADSAALDAEPRTDARLWLVTVAATPGVVLIASPGDWDARALYRTLQDVAQLPVRGYVRVERNQWRSMSDLSPVSDAAVQRAARGADLLVLKGSASGFAERTGARGIWSWPSGEDGETLLAGDWYLSPVETSPVSGAFLGQPVDSFPPATRITPVEPGGGAWVALEAQERRRGAQRPAVIGTDNGRVRRVTVAVDGLWRWAFRGGSSEQAYRAWVAATTSWLLGGADSVRGSARPLRTVVQNGRPIVFEWIAPGPPREAAIGWTGDDLARTDTLRFDGAGRAVTWLPPGIHRYRLSEGGAGTIAVERYSDEFIPRPETLAARESTAPRPAATSSAREWLWLFGLAVLGLAVEWLLRRRLGLR